MKDVYKLIRKNIITISLILSLLLFFNIFYSFDDIILNSHKNNIKGLIEKKIINIINTNTKKSFELLEILSKDSEIQSLFLQSISINNYDAHYYRLQNYLDTYKSISGIIISDIYGKKIISIPKNNYLDFNEIILNKIDFKNLKDPYIDDQAIYYIKKITNEINEDLGFIISYININQLIIDIKPIIKMNDIKLKDNYNEYFKKLIKNHNEYKIESNAFYFLKYIDIKITNFNIILNILLMITLIILILDIYIKIKIYHISKSKYRI